MYSITTRSSPPIAYTHHAWLAGGRNVMAEKFDPVTMPDLMIKERTAYMLMVPTAFPASSRRISPHLKCMLVSAAPISDETAPKAYEIFGDAMYLGYGRTEVLPVAMMGPRHWFAKDAPGSQSLRACALRAVADLGRRQQPRPTAERIVDC